MTYYDSTAPQLEQYPQQQRDVRGRLVALEGGGLDAHARAAASPSFFRRVVLVIAVTVVLACIGAARVALTASTVAILQRSEQLNVQIKEMRTLNSDLQIERSLFSGSDRIGRIATQNLHMVHATEVERLELD